jgi:hypothetical protein
MIDGFQSHPMRDEMLSSTTLLARTYSMAS